MERFQNIEELLAGIQEFVNSSEDDEVKTLADFMLEVALLTDADQDKPEEMYKEAGLDSKSIETKVLETLNSKVVIKKTN